MNNEAGHIIETERLMLRRMQVGDAEFILRLLNEPAFLQFIGDRGVRTREDAEVYIARAEQSSSQQGFGLHMVEGKAERLPLGICGFMQRTWLDSPDLAYAFVSESWGKGFAIEAARGLMQFARADLALGRIYAVVTPQNARSIRLLEKLEFRRERTITDPAAGTELDLFVNAPGDLTSSLRGRRHVRTMMP